jgi:hypothetical protein
MFLERGNRRGWKPEFYRGGTARLLGFALASRICTIKFIPHVYPRRPQPLSVISFRRERLIPMILDADHNYFFGRDSGGTRPATR